MLKRTRIPLIILSVALLAGLLEHAGAQPGLAMQSTPGVILTQTGQALPTPGPLRTPAASPTPEAMDDRPVERNPFLVAGGVLIFLVIIFGVWRYSRPHNEH
jgi:hypothetical protein